MTEFWADANDSPEDVIRALFAAAGVERGRIVLDNTGDRTVIAGTLSEYGEMCPTCEAMEDPDHYDEHPVEMAWRIVPCGGERQEAGE